VIVQGLNLKKKHVKPSQQHPKGGLIEIEGPIHISNVAPCDENGTRLKLKVEKDAQGARQFYSMKNGERVVHRPLKSKLA
jgi:large subunit ribosomal protein L24